LSAVASSGGSHPLPPSLATTTTKATSASPSCCYTVTLLLLHRDPTAVALCPATPAVTVVACSDQQLCNNPTLDHI